MEPEQPDQLTRSALTQLIYGYRVSAAISVAAALGLADHLNGRPKTSDELAAATGAHPPTLHRIMRALATLGIVEERTDGQYALTSLGEPLRADARSSLRGAALQFGGEDIRVWSQLLHTVRTGETTFDHVHGISGFEYFGRNPEVSKAFNERMAAGTRQVAADILKAYDFSRFRTIVDIGGGQGTLLAAILAACPHAHGIVADLPSGLGQATSVIEAAGLGDRGRTAAIDFFESVPAGGDCYVLKSVIHDWDDDRATTILQNVRSVIAGDGRLVVLEPVMPDRVGPFEPAQSIVMYDLNMMVNTGGRERTQAEFAGLFAATGFRLDTVRLTGASWPLSLIEGSPV